MGYVQMLVCAVHKLQIQMPGNANRGLDAAAGRALQMRERSSGESTHPDWGGFHPAPSAAATSRFDPELRREGGNTMRSETGPDNIQQSVRLWRDGWTVDCQGVSVRTGGPHGSGRPCRERRAPPAAGTAPRKTGPSPGPLPTDDCAVNVTARVEKQHSIYMIQTIDV